MVVVVGGRGGPTAAASSHVKAAPVIATHADGSVSLAIGSWLPSWPGWHSQHHQHTRTHARTPSPAAAAAAVQAVPIIVAEADDPASLARMAAGTDVIISTAGPFAKYGSKVVEAAVEQGSHYCDITGGVR
jgi:hypothetical protein